MIRHTLLRRWIWLVAALTAGTAAAAKPAVKNVKVEQRGKKVDVQYQIVCDDPAAKIHVFFNGWDKKCRNRREGHSVQMFSLEGPGADGPVTVGAHKVVWDAGADVPKFDFASFGLRVEAVRQDKLYMIVDLSGGPNATKYPVSYAASLPDPIPDGYKTTNLVLRYCPPGTFPMGSARESHEDTLHLVTLTRPFYIGVFELTQKQWELVMGHNPSGDRDKVLVRRKVGSYLDPSIDVGPTRPVKQVSYNDIRGKKDGAGWPTHNRVDPGSFMGRLRSRCKLLFDLPTEAQWEYACRAGTTTDLNSGKAVTKLKPCPNMSEVGWYGQYRPGGTHTKVGRFLPNRWGLYDMHGNVWEWCRDWKKHHGSSLGKEPVTDPKGLPEGMRDADHRAVRSGSWLGRVGPGGCRSFYRQHAVPGFKHSGMGFRAAVFQASIPMANKVGCGACQGEPESTPMKLLSDLSIRN